MAVARVIFASRWMDSGLEGKLISTVHDSIVTDVPEKNVKACAEIMFDTFRDLPKSISKAYGVDWNLPLICEVAYGPNMKEQTVITL